MSKFEREVIQMGSESLNGIFANLPALFKKVSLEVAPLDGSWSNSFKRKQASNAFILQAHTHTGKTLLEWMGTFGSLGPASDATDGGIQRKLPYCKVVPKDKSIGISYCIARGGQRQLQKQT